jgi:ABC-type phosphonate transport system ATPase subunit
MSAHAELLAVRDLSVSFVTEGGVARVLDAVSLSLAPGEIMGLVANPAVEKPRWRVPSLARCQGMRTCKAARCGSMVRTC